MNEPLEPRTGNTIPNLDGMPEAELMSFWSRYHRASRKDAAALIGDRRKGYMAIAACLANYACNKSVAMTCRARGDIQGATVYEASAELCYNRLPDDLKW